MVIFPPQSVRIRNSNSDRKEGRAPVAEVKETWLTSLADSRGQEKSTLVTATWYQFALAGNIGIVEGILLEKHAGDSNERDQSTP